MKEDVIDALMEDGEVPKLSEAAKEEKRPIPMYDVEELVEEGDLALRVIDILIILTVVAIVLTLAGII